jgi:2-iminobutanoate/2-iminopropanoate deaminase
MRKQILSDRGAPPQGPYSPAIVTEGPLVFVSGQGPVDPDTGEMRPGSFREQAELTFQNVSVLLEAAGTSWEHAVKVGVFLADLGNFAEMNEIYRRYLTPPFPARTTVEAGLAPGMAIEVDCIAVVPQE